MASLAATLRGVTPDRSASRRPTCSRRTYAGPPWPTPSTRRVFTTTLEPEPEAPEEAALRVVPEPEAAPEPEPTPEEPAPAPAEVEAAAEPQAEPEEKEDVTLEEILEDLKRREGRS